MRQHHEQMTPLEAVTIIEDEESPDEQRLLEAWAFLIKTGYCWQLQGRYGRQAMALIENGTISPSGEVLICV